MKKYIHREMLNRLADELVSDVISTSDADILSEASEDYGSPEVADGHVRGILKSAQQLVAKQRLVAAREAVNEYKESEKCAKVISLDPVRARRALEKTLLAHPESTRELTIAARKGSSALSNSDVLSMLEDLCDLGLFDPDSDCEGGE